MSKKSLVLINALTLLLMLFANFGSFAKIFSTETVAGISIKYNTLFAPAGYAFSIWSLIFILCIGFVVHQFSLLSSNDPKQLISRTGLWFSIGNLSNALWVYCWTNEMLSYAVILIIILLISLIKLMLSLLTVYDKKNLKTLIWVWWPVTIYLGWIIVATVACVATWFIYLGWNGGKISEQFWAIIMIVIGCTIYILLIWKYHLNSTALVGIWAFTAIAARHWGTFNLIAWSAMASTVIIMIVISISIILPVKPTIKKT